MRVNNPTLGVQSAAALVLAACSVALTLGFACAVPLAAFATVAGLFLPRAGAVGAMLAAWAANQAVGFGLLHYPTDPATIEWGAGLGAIALLTLGVARAALAGGRGVLRVVLAFAASFVAYEGAVYAGCLLAGDGTSSFTIAVVGRVFEINAVSFGALLALRSAVRGLGPLATARSRALTPV